MPSTAASAAAATTPRRVRVFRMFGSPPFVGARLTHIGQVLVALSTSEVVRATYDRRKRASAVDHEALERPEEAPRAARDVREAAQPVHRLLAALEAGELLVGERPPELVDDLRRIALELLRRPLQVLRPQPDARRARELGVARRDVHLGVVEERVLVQVRRAEREPLVVDDPDL